MSRQTANQTQQKSQTATPVRSGILQRKCACGSHTMVGGQCRECGKKNQTLQRSLSPSPSRSEDQVPPIVQEVLRSLGQPLDLSTRTLMEPRFRRDFSHVRVHTDVRAAESAGAVNALAYTVGRNIIFGSNQYAPLTASGQRLIAHELTHVLQAGNTPASSELKMGRPDSSEEQIATQNEFSMRTAAGYSAANLLQRKRGGTFGGFFANIGRALADIFTDEPDYDEKTLREYLRYLKDNNDIEDDFDSDNKARAVVKQHLFKAEATSIKVLLVQEMLSGAAFDADEQAILELLQAVNVEERTTIADTVTYAKLHKKFDGDELDQLYALLPKMELFHPRAKKESKTHTFEEFIKKWETVHGKTMTDTERRVLARGCVGITSLNLGIIANPDLRECYDSFEAAWNASRKMNEFLAANFPEKKAIIFSKRFWSGGNDYTPDPKTGRVDMSKYDYSARPGFTNFDYGFYDEATNKWWHANHCEPTIAGPRCRESVKGPMKVYESNLPYYSRDLQDFDEQVFCVGVSTLK